MFFGVFWFSLRGGYLEANIDILTLSLGDSCVSIVLDNCNILKTGLSSTVLTVGVVRCVRGTAHPQVLGGSFFNLN